MFRLYLDEVGNDDLTHVENDNGRYLSLTGVAMEIIHAKKELEPKFDWIRSEIFAHDSDIPLVFHRKEIMQKKGVFGVLNDPEKCRLFDKALIRVINVCDYTVITAFIDKKAMISKQMWRNKHPYHFLMEIIVEKYAQFLERKGATGDIMPEARKGIKDQKLQEAYSEVRAKGTYYSSAAKIQKRILCENLKFRTKEHCVNGLQLADLIAHPSHMVIREKLGHQVNLGDYCEKIKSELLDSKYDRSTYGKIVGYGMKWLP